MLKGALAFLIVSEYTSLRQSTVSHTEISALYFGGLFYKLLVLFVWK